MPPPGYSLPSSGPCGHCTHMIHIRWIIYIKVWFFNTKTNMLNIFETFFLMSCLNQKKLVILISVHCPSDWDHGHCLFSSHIVSILWVISYCTELIPCFLLTVSVSKVVLKHKASFCTMGPQHKGAMMPGKVKTCTLGPLCTLCTSTGDSTVDDGVNVSKPTIQIKCDVSK